MEAATITETTIPDMTMAIAMGTATIRIVIDRSFLLGGRHA